MPRVGLLKTLTSKLNPKVKPQLQKPKPQLPRTEFTATCQTPIRGTTQLLMIPHLNKQWVHSVRLFDLCGQFVRAHSVPLFGSIRSERPRSIRSLCSICAVSLFGSIRSLCSGPFGPFVWVFSGPFGPLFWSIRSVCSGPFGPFVRAHLVPLLGSIWSERPRSIRSVCSIRAVSLFGSIRSLCSGPFSPFVWVHSVRFFGSIRSLCSGPFGPFVRVYSIFKRSNFDRGRIGGDVQMISSQPL